MDSNQAVTHKPVLLNQVIDFLAPVKGETYLDMTAGFGGHAQAVAQLVGHKNLTLIDTDPEAVSRLKSNFTQSQIYNNDFASQSLLFLEAGLKFDMILADLGFSSLQMADLSRSFSFQSRGCLDMRFNPTSGKPLSELLISASEDQLAQILVDFGQERDASAIAKAIKLEPPQTALALAELVKDIKSCRPQRLSRSKIHPATKTFMAFRIWVNAEIKQLEVLLGIAPRLLNSSGRLAVISFHSLEDRLVKRAFKELAGGGYDSEYILKTKKPVVPTILDLANHRQARSAKLRVLERKNF